MGVCIFTVQPTAVKLPSLQVPTRGEELKESAHNTRLEVGFGARINSKFQALFRDHPPLRSWVYALQILALTHRLCRGLPNKASLDPVRNPSPSQHTTYTPRYPKIRQILSLVIERKEPGNCPSWLPALYTSISRKKLVILMDALRG